MQHERDEVGEEADKTWMFVTKNTRSPIATIDTVTTNAKSRKKLRNFSKNEKGKYFKNLPHISCFQFERCSLLHMFSHKGLTDLLASCPTHNSPTRNNGTDSTRHGRSRSARSVEESERDERDSDGHGAWRCGTYGRHYSRTMGAGAAIDGRVVRAFVRVGWRGVAFVASVVQGGH